MHIITESDWDVSNVVENDGVFIDCINLIGSNGIHYDTNHTDYTFARINKEGEPSYITKKNSIS